jgi:hypothetical protein
MSNFNLLKSLIALSMLLSVNVSAKTFANQYTQFELPPGWQCAIEGSEWVCQSENKDRKKEAIIILAAKVRGENDSLAAYQAYLKKDKAYQLPGGKFQKSEPKYTKLKVINKHQWADALHLASEVPGFYTRYLATVKEDLGVAVTFSVTKDMYNVYQGIFDNVVATLRVFRQKKANLATNKMANRGNSDANFDDAVFVDSGENFNIGQVKSQKGNKNGEGDDSMLILLALLGLVIFIVMKLKKKK